MALLSALVPWLAASRKENLCTLANLFPEAVASGLHCAGLDEFARKLWRAHGEGLLTDTDARAVSDSSSPDPWDLREQASRPLRSPLSAPRCLEVTKLSLMAAARPTSLDGGPV
jgi:hypothetical protein